MASVFDVATYILAKARPMTAMKLQKLVYYAQAWSLVWDEKPLFRNAIEAWANGPVVRALYAVHRKKFKVNRQDFSGDPKNLTPEEKETVDAVISFYGGKSSQWLSDLTHAEAPWREARSGLKPGQRGRVIITHAAMHEYYGGLSKQSRAE